MIESIVSVQLATGNCPVGSESAMGALAYAGSTVPYAVPVTAPAPAPVPVQEDNQSARAARVCAQITEDLSVQLKDFEQNYAGRDFYECKPMFDHFEHVVSFVDALTENEKERLKDELSRIQAESLSVMSRLRSINELIERYIAEAEPRPSAAIEQIVTELQNNLSPGPSRAALFARLTGHDCLVAYLREHERIALLGEENKSCFEDLQDEAMSFLNVRVTVRLQISQSYARLGFIDLSHLLRQQAGFLGCRTPGGVIPIRVNTGCRTDENFGLMIEELLRFKQIHGHCDVPRRYRENQQLAIWTANLRARRKRGLVPQERIERLDEIGFCWTSTRPLWQSRFDELAVFIREHGHSVVPLNYSRSPYLGTWVRNLRKEVRRNAVSVERVQQLQSIGFDFEVLDLKWREKFQQLLAYKERFGHCRVPHRWPENRSLARWVNIQREKKRVGRLSVHRAQLLLDAGFEFESVKGRPRKSENMAPTLDCRPL
ncbi:MAG: helicase associated domain-containing protein [Cyanobacteria bacterium SZAS LIN-2]|nr:helicase associated domain-containing protein [Cyanobacteria bacterium SZAS LIN-2]